MRRDRKNSRRHRAAAAPDPFEAALRLLTYRDRSESELRARLLEKENDHAAAYALIALAAEYYRKSYFTYELGQCEKNIAVRESALKGVS